MCLVAVVAYGQIPPSLRHQKNNSKPSITNNVATGTVGGQSVKANAADMAAFKIYEFGFLEMGR